MKEFIKKLIERLEEKEKRCHDMALAEIMNNGHSMDAERLLSQEDTYSNIIRIVNELAEEYNVSEMPTGWIACSERLPEDGVVVDLSCEYMGVLYETVGYLKDGNRGHSYIVDNDVFMRSAVLAWKKRPAPYQPKGE